MFKSLHPRAIGFSVPFDEALTLAHTYGFEGLDLSFPELEQVVEQTSLQAVKERFQAAQLRPGGWALPVDFRRDEEKYRAGLAELPQCATIAQGLGSPWCATAIMPFSDELDYDANMELHTRRLRPIAQILADHGCRFGLEFVGPKTMREGHAHEFISTIEGALELGKHIGTSNIGLLLDSWHWYTSHGTIDEIKTLTAQQIVYVHVNDAPHGLGIDEQIDQQRLLPGASGVIDIVGFLQTLNRIGYGGPVVVEPFNAELEALPYAERVQVTKASLDKVWQQAGLR